VRGLDFWGDRGERGVLLQLCDLCREEEEEVAFFSVGALDEARVRVRVGERGVLDRDVRVLLCRRECVEEDSESSESVSESDSVSGCGVLLRRRVFGTERSVGGGA